MKSRSVFCIALAAMLLMGILAGCVPSQGNKGDFVEYIDPVYPPHYEKVYGELLGADMDAVLEGLGYTAEDFELIHNSDNGNPLCYRSKEMVSYLDKEFNLELWFRDMENGSELYEVACYAEPAGTPEEQAQAAKELHESFKKMFGDKMDISDEKKEELTTLDPAVLAEALGGDNTHTRQWIWELTHDVSHLPEEMLRENNGLSGKTSINLTYSIFHFPQSELPVYFRIAYGTGTSASNHFTK